MEKKSGEIPFSWELIKEQTRKAILVQAGNLEAYGVYDANRRRLISEQYLGIKFEELSPPDGVDLREEWTHERLEDLSDEKVQSINLEDHCLYDTVRTAYNYAYQMRKVPLPLLKETARDVTILLNCFPQYDMMGNSSPFGKGAGHPLRAMLETFQARFSLFEGKGDLTIEQLALLADMTVPAARTALSKEGFKLDKVAQEQDSNQRPKSKCLKHSDGIDWLSRRRGFVPQLPSSVKEVSSVQIKGIFEDSRIEFPAKVNKLLEVFNITIEQLISENSIDGAWIKGLLGGAVVEADVEALSKLAKAMTVPDASFAGMGVAYLLALEKQNA